MIACPKCNTNSGLIMEQPTWRHDTIYDVIDIDCTCVDCRVSFEVVVSLTHAPILEINFKKENYDYPYYGEMK